MVGTGGSVAVIIYYIVEQVEVQKQSERWARLIKSWYTQCVTQFGIVLASSKGFRERSDSTEIGRHLSNIFSHLV